MDSRKRYAGAVLVLLAVALLIAGNMDPKRVRYQQHLEYNTEVRDTSTSISREDFSSHLPVVDIQTDGQVIPGKPGVGEHARDMPNTYVTVRMKIIEKEGQANTLLQEPDIDSDAQIRVRGNSSRFFDKMGYLFSFVDENLQKKGYQVMGMEKNSTWVLHGPFLDKTLMRNYMWYNLSGQIMEWAPDVRFCEVFLNDEYQGVYVMTEQISVGGGRIDVSGYDGNAAASSYIVCVDRQSVNDMEYLENFTFYTRRSDSRVEIKYPGSQKLNPEIAEYISQDFSMFEKSLYSYDYDSKRYGFQNHIDVDSFVDYFIISEVTQNNDAGLYSTYFYKDVGGKLKICVWDFNNCCDNYLDARTEMTGFFMQDRPWYFMLLKDEGFTDKIIRRYEELRAGILSDESVESYIGDIARYLGPAIDRNYLVWGYSFEAENDLFEEEDRKISSYEEALQQYTKRLTGRLGWLDEHIEDISFYSHESKNKKYNH